MTLDDLERQLDQATNEILNITPILTEIGNELTNELRMAAPEKTGALKSSIAVEITPDSLLVSMKDYGAYQNYGVAGTDNQTSQDDVEEGISLRPRENAARYSFEYGVISSSSGLPYAVRRSIGERGLDKKSWFSVKDLTYQVKTRLQQRINQAFE
jgi:hypothetical protein